MRMWLGIAPQEMCDQHLLGEHRELHAIVGWIQHRNDPMPWIAKRLIFPRLLNIRHYKLVKEMDRRGMKHRSPLRTAGLPTTWDHFKPTIEDYERNNCELMQRCPKCYERMI